MILLIIKGIGLIPYTLFTIWFVRKVIRQYRAYKETKKSYREVILAERPVRYYPLDHDTKGA